MIEGRISNHFSIDKGWIVKIWMGFAKLTLWEILWS